MSEILNSSEPSSQPLQPTQYRIQNKHTKKQDTGEKEQVYLYVKV
jgi:hypothetical protein